MTDSKQIPEPGARSSVNSTSMPLKKRAWIAWAGSWWPFFTGFPGRPPIWAYCLSLHRPTQI